MTLSRALAIPAAAVVVLTVVGAWIDGSRSSSAGASATTTNATLLAVTPPASASPTASSAPSAEGQTSCTSVVHIGDSTSVGLMSADYIADPSQRIDAQYARVGVTDFRDEIKGARSIVERYKGQENADDVATRQHEKGFHGCWVLALGTTDAANIGAGASLSAAGRIDRLMGVIGTDPVLWVNVKTLVTDGAWAEPNMVQFDDALTAAATKYPNIKIYDWASVVQDGWFQSDHIHYTSEGYTQRAALIADALATAYPAS